MPETARTDSLSWSQPTPILNSQHLRAQNQTLVPSAPQPIVLEKSLHERGLRLAVSDEELEGQLLLVINKMDEQKIFRAFGYASLFQYVVSELGLSEAIAYQYIHVTRKSALVPQLRESIVAGDLSLSKANIIAPVITSTNASQWIKRAQALSKRELEKAVKKTPWELSL